MSATEEISAALALLTPLARHLTRNDASADDLLQDTALRALRRLHRYRAGSNARAWLGKIMRRVNIDRGRARSSQARAYRRYQAVAESCYRPEEPARPEESIPTGVALARVRGAAEGLPEPFRTTFLLRTNARLSYREIGRRLGIPSSTVGGQLRRARLALRRQLACTAAGDHEGEE